MTETTVADQIVIKPRRKNTLGSDINTLRPALAEIERFHAWFVKNVAANNYSVPVVYTIQTRARKVNLLGSFIAAYDYDDKAKPVGGNWGTKEGGQAHEINIVPEAFAEDPLSILCTVAHEIVHMFMWDTEVKGVSKSGRHNKLFKEQAEDFGMVCEDSGKQSLGFITVGFTDEMKARVEKEFNVDVQAFNNFKNALIEKPKGRKSTVAFHVPSDESAPVIRLAKGKAEDAEGSLMWGDVAYEIKPE